jgi:hypothetical protein
MMRYSLSPIFNSCATASPRACIELAIPANRAPSVFAGHRATSKPSSVSRAA